jgi:tRNA U34 5-methylaminomethyl-2-thiouridine-forming methyltransferase MnmC
MENTKRAIITSADGSHTVSIPGLNITYHSHHGAIKESRHVFIEAGWNELVKKGFEGKMNIFEMGFGTGLNAFLTLIEANKHGIDVHYTSVEQFPLTSEEASALNYPQVLGFEKEFHQLHASPWNREVRLTDFFTLKKIHSDLQSVLSCDDIPPVHLVYFDAFAPSVQPALWTKEIFEPLNRLMAPGGMLVTYCSKGDVKRAMKGSGFKVKKIPGPYGKRDMVRAQKPPGRGDADI